MHDDVHRNVDMGHANMLCIRPCSKGLLSNRQKVAMLLASCFNWINLLLPESIMERCSVVLTFESIMETCSVVLTFESIL